MDSTYRLDTLVRVLAVSTSCPKKSRSERGYDRLALAYQMIEWVVFGGRLQAARVALLDELPPWQCMLILGDGDGRLLHAIVQRMSEGSDQTIVSVDQSESMLSRQRQRTANYSASRQIEWIKGDALSFIPHRHSFDVIVTPFFLDCFSEEQLQIALPRWFDGLRRNGKWYYVDFVIPESGWRRIGAAWLSRIMHCFFRLMTGLPNAELLNVAAMLRQLGLEPEYQTNRFGGMIATAIYGPVNSINGSVDSFGDESSKN